ncbi:DUF2577 domain-containing protein [Paenibacillus sp. FSL H8-0034]|uniref:DUF2577 domain-containing protein n=1 Tax=Paenibacillus sp. FSL H8-0034 TaxID=2954671 RepID=UPI0030F60106
MLEIMKSTSIGVIQAGYPASIFTGKVIQLNPLEVTLDPQRDPLTEDFLLVPESMTHYEIDLKHLHTYLDASDSGDTTRSTEETLQEPIVIRRGLEINDVVLLLRVQGGQQYVILDRVVQS